MFVPGGSHLATSELFSAAAMNSASSIRSITASARRAMRSTVKPSGKVTLVLVWAGGIRNLARTFPI